MLYSYSCELFLCYNCAFKQDSNCVNREQRDS